MRASEESAFREFAEAAMPRLRRVAIGVSRDPHTADDLVQSTMEKLYVSWQREVVSDEVGEAAPPSADHARSTEDRVVLGDALAGLTARQRACVVLRHLEGLSVAETATTLGVSHGTVKSTTSDALARLRSRLDNREGVSS